MALSAFNTWQNGFAGENVFKPKHDRQASLGRYVSGEMILPGVAGTSNDQTKLFPDKILN